MTLLFAVRVLALLVWLEALSWASVRCNPKWFEQQQ